MAVKPPPSFEEWQQILERRGAETASQIFRNALKEDPAAPLFSEGVLNRFGYTLLRKKQYRESVAVLHLNVEAHPSSTNAYDSLSEACEASGDQSAALDWALKGLEALQAEGALSEADRKELKDSLERRVTRLKEKKP